MSDAPAPEGGDELELYAARKKIHPKRARGEFRRFKWIVMAITLTIYYVTPWIRWDRGEFAPDQAVLVDLANRRFYFFWIEIWPQEFFFVAGLLVMAGVGLFLVTSVVGRAWCGYSCPQTVWTDLFLVVERFFEGDRNARIKLDRAPWTTDKIKKRVLKHATWIVIGVLTGGAWIFYFADAPTLLAELVRFEAPAVAYMTIAILTATTYVFGGHLREQVCIYMCPWPRIQAAMLDEDSLVVTYNDWRGEPRTHGAKRAEAEGAPMGDCIDCNACVAVCPTGVDIREGQQIGCITCALCIDACDEVMTKLGRERGLISYATLRDYRANMELATDPASGAIDPARARDPEGRLSDAVRRFDWKVFVRPRTLVYLGVWCAIGLGLLTALAMRDRLELTVQHDRNPLYVTLRDGSIRNGFDVKILNMLAEERTVRLEIEGLDGGRMRINGIDAPASDGFSLPLAPDRSNAFRVFVRVPPEQLEPGARSFSFVATDPASNVSDRYQTQFNAPDDR